MKLLAACILSLTLAACTPTPITPASWVMIDATEGPKQADAHLIVFDTGDYGLIDTGFSEQKIVPFLKKNKIDHIANIWITHPHKDHYGGVRPILEAGIKVDHLWINVPSKSFCDVEIPWGCDYAHLTSAIEFAKSKGVIVTPTLAGQVLHESGKVKLESLIAYDDKTSPTGRQGGINDTSVIMRLTTEKNKVLFTGDLNIPLGTYLATHAKPGFYSADLIKVPHHGTEGCAPDAFFDLVGAQYAFVPAPEELWFSDRSKRIRDYFLKHAKQVYVSGMHGTITVDLKQNPVVITKERWWKFK